VATSLSARKRIRQNAVLRARNKTRRSAVKTQVRRFADALRSGDVAKAKDEFRAVVKKLDQTAAKGTLHKNAVSRTKSRLAKRLNKLAAAIPPA